MARILFIFAGLLLLTPLGAALAKDGGVSVELNKLEKINDACRAYLVVKNNSPSAFESLKLDLVLFDLDGVVSKRLAVETAPLSVGKTSLKVFDLASQPCERISRVLLNAIVACRDSTGTRSDCLQHIETTTRSPIAFIK